MVIKFTGGFIGNIKKLLSVDLLFPILHSHCFDFIVLLFLTEDLLPPLNVLLLEKPTESP